MINKENVLALRNHLAKIYLKGGEDQFTMLRFCEQRDYCKSPCCIAGYAVWLKSKGEYDFNFNHANNIQDDATSWLGLDWYQSMDLCHTQYIGDPGGKVRPKLIHAIDVLHRLAITGKVEWKTNPTIKIKKGVKNETICVK